MARSTMPPAVGYLLHGPLPAPDRAALHDALGAHSPTLEPDPPEGCWLDLRGGRRGPDPATTVVAALATAVAWGVADARLGLAPTPGVARLAAHHGTGPLTLLDVETVPAFLAPLPLAAVGLDDDAATRLALVGLRTLGDVAALARGALGDYLGPLGPALEAVARGEDARPLVPARAPLVLTARRDLDWALDDRAALAALLGRLLDPLLASLHQRGLGATRVAARLTDAAGGATTTTVRLRAPTTARDAVLAPLLAALPVPEGREQAGDGADGAAGDRPGGGVTAILLALTAPRPLASVQASFFDVPQGRRGLLAEGVAEGQRRGAGRLGYLAPVDLAHPRPERRYAFVEGLPPGTDEAAS
jgi:protein ImuB